MPARRTRLADVSASSWEDQGTLISTAAYKGALERFGGRRIEATSSGRCSELLVALYESPPYDLKVAPIDVARLSIPSGPSWGSIFFRGRATPARRIPSIVGGPWARVRFRPKSD